MDASKALVSSVMTRRVVTVRSDLSLESLVDLLLQRDLSRIPVVDENNRLVGIVSKTDLISEQGEKSGAPKGGFARAPGPQDMIYPIATGARLHEISGSVVSDVMHKEVLSIAETASIAEVAKLMATRHLHGVPVLTKDRRVVGMVSSLDVLSWVAGLQRG
jgi:CBS domain-containing protein